MPEGYADSRSEQKDALIAIAKVSSVSIVVVTILGNRIRARLASYQHIFLNPESLSHTISYSLMTLLLVPSVTPNTLSKTP